MKNLVFSFAHISDAHLGFKQYGTETRRMDFRRAFSQCIDEAIRLKVNALLLGGDTFHNTKPDFCDLIDLRDKIQKCKNNEITVMAILGNHDNIAMGDYYSWIDLFPDVIDLDPLFTVRDDLALAPSLFESGDKLIAFYGLSWTKDVEADVQSKVIPTIKNSSADFNILLLHAGLGGMIPQDKGQISQDFIASISRDSWKVKDGDVALDYIGLGHLHKPYKYYRAYNPGSLEYCSSTEWDYDGRGMIIVKLYDDGSVETTRFSPDNREAKAIRIPVSMNSTIEHLISSADLLLKGIGENALIQIELFGTVSLPVTGNVLNELKTHINQTYSPLHVRMKDSTLVTNRQIVGMERITSTSIPDIAFQEVFGEYKDVASSVADAVSNGERVEKIIDILEEHLSNAEDQEDNT